MAEPVVVVAFKAEKTRNCVNGHMLEGVVPADGVKGEEYEHQAVGSVGESDAAPVHQENHCNRYPRGEVLRPPDTAVNWRNAQQNCFHNIEKQQAKRNNGCLWVIQSRSLGLPQWRWSPRILWREARCSWFVSRKGIFDGF